MKHIYLNLKRFDVPVEFGGVNRLAPVADWASCIVKNTQEELKTYDPSEVEFGMYFPEVHLLNAVAAKTEGSPVQIGCQSVFRADTAVGGNFGAFTTNRPASAMVAAGCETTIIGHCEERNDKAGILAEAGVTDTDAVNRLLNQEIKCAIERGMKVLYCIGEKSEEQEQWQEVLGKQLEIGLKDVDTSKVVIAYEPIWSIGPGKTPAGKEYITKIAGRIYKESQRLLQLVEDVIQISQLDEEKTSYVWEPVDVYQVCKNAFESLKEKAKSLNVHLYICGERMKMEAVRTLLEEAIYNVCDNAIKYNRNDGSVSVFLTQTAQEIQIVVKDTGVGIPKEDQDRVFERFYRVDKSHSKEIGGTGLGLSIVKHAVGALKGSVILRSEEGNGTEICMKFPKVYKE